MTRPLTSSRAFILRPWLVLIILALLFASSALLIRSSASQSAVINGSGATKDQPQQGAQGPTTCSSCPQPTRQVIYAPLFDLPEAASSEIVLNCRSAQDITITPTFYTLDGTPYIGEDITLKAAEIRFVDTKSLIPEKERSQHKWGGISFSYTGTLMQAWAQLTLHGIHGGGSANIVFTVLNQSRPSSSDAVWWVPRKGNTLIALGNSSAQQIDAQLTFSNGRTHVAKIAPFATEIVRLEPDLSNQHQAVGSVEAVSLSHTGSPGGLIPTGITSSGDGKFASMIRFYSTPGVVQPNLYANNLRLENATLHMVLRNTSSAPITASPRFLTEKGQASDTVKLSAVKLAPYEAREINLDPLMTAAANRADLDSVGVQVLNSGEPGSLIGALYSLNAETGVSYDVPLRDSGSIRANTGGYPIRLDGDYTTVVAITNVGEKPSDFTLQINHDGGTYATGIVSLNLGETKTLDIRKLRDEQTPDINGQPLPREMRIAQAVWSVRGDSSNHLTGRSEIVSRKDGVSSSYSCSLCCQSSFYRGWIEPIDSTFVFVGGTRQFFALEQTINNCYGGPSEPYPAPAWWYSTDESVVTVGNYMHDLGIVTGVSAGVANIACDWTTYRWVYDDIDQWCEEFVEQFEDHRPTDVRPTISGPTVVWWFNGANPGNANMPLSIQLTTQSGGSSYNWTANSTGDGSVTLQNATTNTVTVTGAAMSNLANDIKITVTVNGVTSAEYAITVKAPNQLARTNIEHLGSAAFGYRTEITYTIRDQFNALLPGGNIQVNEDFTGNAVPDFSGTNWTITEEKVFTLPNPVFSDVIEGENLTKNPTPQTPQNPTLGSTKVVHWGQDIYVGSTTVGSGKKVQTATFQKYRDHADHEAVTSPVR